jgi:TfoX/Sxy family transcriptional regulator of competence genes
MLAPDVQARFAAIAEGLAGRDGVAIGTGRRGFGSDALTVKGRIFAMLTRGQLIVKLPADRVSALIDAGDGAPFDAGKGRAMKEWVALTPRSSRRWRALAEEACRFVGNR